MKKYLISLLFLCPIFGFADHFDKHITPAIEYEMYIYPLRSFSAKHSYERLVNQAGICTRMHMLQLFQDYKKIFGENDNTSSYNHFEDISYPLFDWESYQYHQSKIWWVLDYHNVRVPNKFQNDAWVDIYSATDYYRRKIPYHFKKGKHREPITDITLPELLGIPKEWKDVECPPVVAVAYTQIFVGCLMCIIPNPVSFRFGSALVQTGVIEILTFYAIKNGESVDMKKAKACANDLINNFYDSIDD